MTTLSCDTIEGTLTISSSFTGNTSLYLSSIQEITGDLTITNAGDLTSVYLPDLQTVDGSVTVKDNDGLKNLTLSQLQDVKGGLEIQGNNALESVDLRNLEDVNSGLTLNGGFGYVFSRFLLHFHPCIKLSSVVYPSPTSTRSTATQASPAPAYPAGSSTD